jgi:hypothetical protein
MFQVGHAADKLKKVIAIDPQDIDCGAAAHGRISCSALG